MIPIWSGISLTTPMTDMSSGFQGWVKGTSERRLDDQPSVPWHTLYTAPAVDADAGADATAQLARVPSIK